MASNREWNVKATLAVLAFLLINVAALIGIYTGGVSFKDYMATLGTFNGTAVGWLFRSMT